MYFGIYQIASRHREFDALPYEAPCSGPSLLSRLMAFLRREPQSDRDRASFARTLIGIKAMKKGIGRL